MGETMSDELVERYVRELPSELVELAEFHMEGDANELYRLLGEAGDEHGRGVLRTDGRDELFGGKTSIELYGSQDLHDDHPRRDSYVEEDYDFRVTLRPGRGRVEAEFAFREDALDSEEREAYREALAYAGFDRR